MTSLFWPTLYIELWMERTSSGANLRHTYRHIAQNVDHAGKRHHTACWRSLRTSRPLAADINLLAATWVRGGAGRPTGVVCRALDAVTAISADRRRPTHALQALLMSTDKHDRQILRIVRPQSSYRPIMSAVVDTMWTSAAVLACA